MTGYPAIPLPGDKPATRRVIHFDPRDAGELSYAFNLMLLEYLGKRDHTLNAVDECLGALRGCTLGLEQRRVELVTEATSR